MALKKLPGGVVVETTAGAWLNEAAGVNLEAIHRQLGVRGEAAADRAELAAANAVRAFDAVLAMSGIGPTSPVDAQTAALIGQAGTLTRKALDAAVAAARVTPFGVRVDAYGVVGDGVADDTDAFHAAASAAATLGVPLVLRGGMTITINSYKQLPDHLILHTNGAVFRQQSPMGRVPVLGFGNHPTVVGGLHVRTLGGEGINGAWQLVEP